MRLQRKDPALYGGLTPKPAVMPNMSSKYGSDPQVSQLLNNQIYDGAAKIQERQSVMAMVRENIVKPVAVGAIAGIGTQVLAGGTFPIMGYQAPTGLIVGFLALVASAISEWSKTYIENYVAPDGKVWGSVSLLQAALVGALLSIVAYFDGSSKLIAFLFGSVAQLGANTVL